MTKILITGLDKTIKKIKKSITTGTTNIIAEEYRIMLIDNLQESKKTGKLIQSFKIKTNTLYSIIESDLPYAKIQDEGGKIMITDLMRKKMWELYKQTNLSVYKAIAITKKKYIIIPAKHYTNINKNTFKKRIYNKLRKKISINYKTL